MAANISASSDVSEAIRDQIDGLIPVIVYLVLVSIVGLTGNSFVYYVYRSKFRLSTASTFFIWLSLVNIITCSVVIPVEVVLIFSSYNLKYDWLCKLSRFFNSWTTISTGTILVVIAADRYQKICKLSWRQFNMRKARIASMMCIAIGVVCSWPSLVLFAKKPVKIPGSNAYGGHCMLSEVVSNTYYPLVYELMYMTVFIISVVSVTFWYYRIYQKIKSQARKTSSMTSLASIQTYNSGAEVPRERSKSLDMLSSPFTIEDSSDVEISVSKSDSCLNTNAGESDADLSPRLNRRVTWKAKMVGIAEPEEFTDPGNTWQSNDMLIASLGLPPRRRSILKRRYTARPERTVGFENNVDDSTENDGDVTDETKVIRSKSMRFERSRNNFTSFKQTRKRPKFRLEIQAPSEEGFDRVEQPKQEPKCDEEKEENDPEKEQVEEEVVNIEKSCEESDSEKKQEHELKSDDVNGMTVEPHVPSINASPILNRSLITRKKGGSILKPVSPPILTKTMSTQNDDVNSNISSDSTEHQPRERTDTLDSSSETIERVPKGRKRTSSITDFGSEILPLSWTARRISWRVYTARRTAYIMCSITASAFLSYTPVLCLETYRALGQDCEDYMTNPGRATYNFFLRSYFLNVAISPFVYGAFDSKFRSACGDIVRDVKWKLEGIFHR